MQRKAGPNRKEKAAQTRNRIYEAQNSCFERV